MLMAVEISWRIGEYAESGSGGEDHFLIEHDDEHVTLTTPKHPTNGLCLVLTLDEAKEFAEYIAQIDAE